MMAMIEKRGQRWRVRVRLNGQDLSESFRTKTEAKAWAAQAEADIIAGKHGSIPDKDFGGILMRYLAEVSVKKDGHRWEEIRINRILGIRSGDADPIVYIQLKELGPEHFAAWRDRRLKKVSSATVAREWNLLSSACTVAAREWRWLRENPMRHVKRPKNSAPRQRRIGQDEIQQILSACGYHQNKPPLTKQSLVGAVFLFAIETAMRAGEICALKWDDIDERKRLAHVRAIARGARKNRVARSVPLSTQALRIVDQVRGMSEEWVFNIATGTLDALFRRAKNKDKINDLHFHDTRAEALTRLSKRLDVMQLARVSCHTDVKILYRVYYRESIDEIGKLLD
jgi:integrase